MMVQEVENYLDENDKISKPEEQENQICKPDTKTINRKRSERKFLRKLLSQLHLLFFRKGRQAQTSKKQKQIGNKTASEPRKLRDLMSFGEGIVSISKLMGVGKFKYEFSKTIIRYIELLGHPDLKLRTQARKSMVRIVSSTGPFFFGIVIRELRKGLVEGKLKFVRNFTLAFILEEIYKEYDEQAKIKATQEAISATKRQNGQGGLVSIELAEEDLRSCVFRPGDLDAFAEDICDLALEEIGVFALANRTSYTTRGVKWKEMISPKAGLLFCILGRRLDVRSGAVISVLAKFAQFLRRAKEMRTALNQIEKALNQFKRGLEMNLTFVPEEAFILAESQMRVHIRSETEVDKVQKKQKSGFIF